MSLSPLNKTALPFAVLLTVSAAIVLGWYYQDQADAVLAGALVGLMCGWWFGFLVAALVMRRPRREPPVVIVEPPEISPAALEWHEATHG